MHPIFTPWKGDRVHWERMDERDLAIDFALENTNFMFSLAINHVKKGGTEEN